MYKEPKFCFGLVVHLTLSISPSSLVRVDVSSVTSANNVLVFCSLLRISFVNVYNMHRT